MPAPQFQNEGAGEPNRGAKHPRDCDSDCALRYSMAQLWSIYDDVSSGGAFEYIVAKLCTSCKKRWRLRFRRWRCEQKKRKREDDSPGPQGNNGSAPSSSRRVATTEGEIFKKWWKRQLVAGYKATNEQKQCATRNCLFPALAHPDQRYCTYHSEKLGYLHVNTTTCSRTFVPQKKGRKCQSRTFPIKLPTFNSLVLAKRPHPAVPAVAVQEYRSIHERKFHIEHGELDKAVGRTNLAFLNQEHVEMTPMLNMILKTVDNCDTLVCIACLRTEVEKEDEAFYSLLEACTAACLAEAQALEENAAAAVIARLQNNHMPDARAEPFISSKRVAAVAKVAYHLLLIVHHWRRFEQFPDESHSLSIYRWWLQNNKQGLQTTTPNDPSTFTDRDRHAKLHVWEDLWSAAFYRDLSLTTGICENAEGVIRDLTIYDSWFITLAQSYLLHVDPHANPPQGSASLTGAGTIQNLAGHFAKLLKVLMLRKTWHPTKSRELASSDDMDGLWLRKSSSFVEVTVLGIKARRQLGLGGDPFDEIL